MAAPSPRRDLWLTFAAAAATLVVVSGVLAGPSILACSNSPIGFVQCMRESVVEAGLLPSMRETPPANPAPAQTAKAAAQSNVPEAPAEPEPSVGRAELDGSLRVSGTGRPGVTVEVVANGIAIGEAMAETSGGRPIDTGRAEITVGIAGENVRADRSFVVVVPREPPVIVSNPGGSSQVLQGMAAVGVDVALSVPRPVGPIAVADVPDENVVPPPEPVPEPVAEPAPLAGPTIDAIEIDGDANFFAGAGVEGATVRLYVENHFVAAAKVEGGRWLVEARGALKLPRQRVRIEMLQAQGSSVAARAEVYFVIELPDQPQVAVSGAATGGANAGGAAGSDLTVAPAEAGIPTLTTVTTDPEMLRFASGKAIIRRGENLWSIARRVYGDGRRYNEIFEANRQQLRTPGEIYPGQVFDLPRLEDGARDN